MRTERAQIQSRPVRSSRVGITKKKQEKKEKNKQMMSFYQPKTKVDDEHRQFQQRWTVGVHSALLYM